jgi:hypothetical protein
MNRDEYLLLNRRLYRALIPKFVESECAQSADVRACVSCVVVCADRLARTTGASTRRAPMC